MVRREVFRVSRVPAEVLQPGTSESSESVERTVLHEATLERQIEALQQRFYGPNTLTLERSADYQQRHGLEDAEEETDGADGAG